MSEALSSCHVDPDGVSPNQRITSALGEIYYINSTSENIAFSQSGRDFSADDYPAVAQQFMSGWINSSGHRANILRASTTHIGVGLHRSGNRIYATKKFMGYVVARDQDTLPSEISIEDPVLSYQLNRALEVSQDDVVVRVSLPDPGARWTSSDGRIYTGFMFAQPEWRDASSFSIVLPVEFGPGTYRVQFGTQGGNRTSTEAFSYTVTERDS